MAVRGKFANKVRRKRGWGRVFAKHGWVHRRNGVWTRTLDGRVDGDELQLRECAGNIKPAAGGLDLFACTVRVLCLMGIRSLAI